MKGKRAEARRMSRSRGGWDWVELKYEGWEMGTRAHRLVTMSGQSEVQAMDMYKC